MKKRCLIISGGEFHPISVPGGECFVIACDRGYDYALRCGIRPDLVVSDFDSGSAQVEEDIPVNRFKSEKDDTDTMIAIRYACEHGFEEAWIVCALGGRLDHLLANLQSAVFAQLRGLQVRISSPDTEILTLAASSVTLPKREGWSLSVFAANDQCRGVSILGAKYELHEVELTNGFPLGVSNEWKDGPVTVSVKEGILVIVSSKL